MGGAAVGDAVRLRVFSAWADLAVLGFWRAYGYHRPFVFQGREKPLSVGRRNPLCGDCVVTWFPPFALRSPSITAHVRR